MGNSGSSGGTSSPLTTKGDVWGFSTVNARVPVGSNGQVLTARSSASQGVDWEAGAAATSSYSVVSISGGDQNVNQNTQTKVNFGTIVKDPGSNYDTTNKWFVVPTTGTYLVFIQIDLTATLPTGVTNEILLVKGASTTVARAFNDLAGTTITLAAMIPFTAADQVEVDVFIGQAQTIKSDPTFTWYNIGLYSTA